MNTRTWWTGIIAAVFAVGVLESCKEKSTEPDDPGNEQEFISTVILSLVDSASQAVTSAAWKDLDGAGGAAPQIDTLVLTSGRTYYGSVEVLNETVSPPDTITHEIENEQNSHQFFYTATGGIATRVTVQKTDQDTNNPPLPVGLVFTARVTAGGTANGALNVVLSHYDEVQKSANPSPESDVDINVPARIQ